MAKIKLSGLEGLRESLRRDIKIELNKIFRDESLRYEVGQIVKRDIQQNKLKDAETNTIKTRRYLERFNTTGEGYDIDKVKAIFTGKLLDDLAANVRGAPDQLTFEIDQSNKVHGGYRTANGKINNSITFKELGDILRDDKGLNYLNISQEARQDIVKAIQKTFERVFTNKPSS